MSPSFFSVSFGSPDGRRGSNMRRSILITWPPTPVANKTFFELIPFFVLVTPIADTGTESA